MLAGFLAGAERVMSLGLNELKASPDISLIFQRFDRALWTM
jgi:hypothetical protein